MVYHLYCAVIWKYSKFLFFTEIDSIQVNEYQYTIIL